MSNIINKNKIMPNLMIKDIPIGSDEILMMRMEIFYMMMTISLISFLKTIKKTIKQIVMIFGIFCTFFWFRK